MDSGSIDKALVIEWDDSEHPYPLGMYFHRNKEGVELYGRDNEHRAGFGLMCAPSIHLLSERMQYPRVPRMIHLIAAFVAKPKHIKCWFKWWYYCFLEMKEWALVLKGYWTYVPSAWLWVLRTFDGKLMIFSNEDDIPEEINKDQMKRYHWSREENQFLPWEPEPRDPIDTLKFLMEAVSSVRAGC